MIEAARWNTSSLHSLKIAVLPHSMAQQGVEELQELEQTQSQSLATPSLPDAISEECINTQEHHDRRNGRQ